MPHLKTIYAVQKILEILTFSVRRDDRKLVGGLKQDEQTFRKISEKLPIFSLQQFQFFCLTDLSSY